MRLRDKVSIVTGGAAGMGRSVALRFGNEGAKVVVVDINETCAEVTAEGIRRSGGDAIAVRTDVSLEDDVRRMVDAAVDRYGHIDILYNNAAVLFHDGDARVHELSTEVWERTIGVNLRGVWLCSKYVVRVMLGNGGGSIINVGSPTGLKGCAANLTAYSASKGGVTALTRVMAAGYGRDRIRVNALIPGPIDTPMNTSVFADDEFRGRLEAETPLGRLGSADEVAGLAVFLASDESSYCTGGLYMADGGATAV